MANVSEQLKLERAVRKVAKDRFDGQLALVKHDVQPAVIAGRLSDKVAVRAKAAIDEAVEITEKHPRIVAGTIGALVVWFLRDSIFGLFGKSSKKRKGADT